MSAREIDDSEDIDSEGECFPEVPEVMAPAEALSPGLYVTAVPLGNARDITLRALDVLRCADLVICEDTRMTRRLCDLHGVSPRGMAVYHDHSPDSDRERLVRLLAEGKGSAALVSDAGTPLISDPGYKLVNAMRAAGVTVHAVPGPCALAAALSVGGAPSDKVFFAGFLPSKTGARRTSLQEYQGIPATLVFYESPRRLADCLADVAVVLPGRRVSVCRELTKRYEEVVVASAEDLSALYADPARARGECVVLVHPADRSAAGAYDSEALSARMSALLGVMRVKDAVNALRAETGVAAKDLYALALSLKA